jgi:hypothetical protein
MIRIRLNKIRVRRKVALKKGELFIKAIIKKDKY